MSLTSISKLINYTGVDTHVWLVEGHFSDADKILLGVFARVPCESLLIPESARRSSLLCYSYRFILHSSPSTSGLHHKLQMGGLHTYLN